MPQRAAKQEKGLSERAQSADGCADRRTSLTLRCACRQLGEATPALLDHTNFPLRAWMTVLSAHAQRTKRIRRNRDMLQQLGVQQAAAAAACAAPPPRAASHPNPGEVAALKRRAPPPEALEPTRRSARGRGAEPGASAGPGEGGDPAAASPGAFRTHCTPC